MAENTCVNGVTTTLLTGVLTPLIPLITDPYLVTYIHLSQMLHASLVIPDLRIGGWNPLFVGPNTYSPEYLEDYTFI